MEGMIRSNDLYARVVVEVEFKAEGAGEDSGDLLMHNFSCVKTGL